MRVLLSLFLSSYVFVSYAKIIYVGVGSQYANLNLALPLAQPGDSLILTDLQIRGGMAFNNINGTADQPISIFGNPSGKTTISGGSNSIQFSDCNYLVISDLIIVGQTGNGLNIDDGSTFDTPSRGIIIQNCIFKDIAATGNNDLLKLSGLDSFEVRHCQFGNGSPGGSGIDMVGCHFGVIHHCLFENQGTNSIQAKGGCKYLVYHSNQFINGGARALNLGGSTGLQFFRPLDATNEASEILVHSNYFEGAESSFAFVGCENVTVINNTIKNPTKWAMRILQETVDTTRFAPCRNNQIINNIFLIDQRVTTQVNIGPNTAPSSFVFQSNLWFNSANLNWAGPNLPTRDLTQIVKDPLLTIGSKYKLATNSPAKQKGSLHKIPILDIEAKKFLVPPSIGCFEFDQSTQTHNSIQKNIATCYLNTNSSEIIFKEWNDYPSINMTLASLSGQMKSVSLHYGKLEISELQNGLYFLIESNTKQICKWIK